MTLRLLSAAEQVAVHLRSGLEAGDWAGEMPGVLALAAELGVNHKTVEAALRILERDGVLENQGARKPRRVRAMALWGGTASLRIGILLHGASDERMDYIQQIVYRLREAGHRPFFTKRSLTDLGMDAEKVAAYISAKAVDAWVVVSGSREVLEWFAKQPVPVFRLFGFIRSLPLAGVGPDRTPAFAEVARALLDLGHRRIVILARRQNRHPLPGHAERHFLRMLGEAGIHVGDYHFPDWPNTREGLQRCLAGLFRGTPPTALVVQEAFLFGAVEQFLLERGIRVPHDVSLVCDEPDPTFAWRIPTVAHIRWSSEPLVRAVVRWAGRIAQGKDDRKRTLSKAEFVPGGTIGPVPRK